MKILKKMIIKPKEQPMVSLDASVINPEVFANKTKQEIENLLIWQGNRRVNFGEFFEIENEAKVPPQEIEIVIEGDVSRTKHIGESMGVGTILIRGNVGMYVGARMSGGKIVVEGNAGAWAGQEMAGGELVINGDADNYLGSAYRGGIYGMRGGIIILKGNAGNEIGEWMSGGKILIKGNVGSFAGVHMQGGTIVIEGNAKERIGAEMKGGIILVKQCVESLLPSFLIEGEVNDPIIGDEKIIGTYFKFKGDMVMPNPKGNLYLSKIHNKHILA